jgi:hypothetical protein
MSRFIAMRALLEQRSEPSHSVLPVGRLRSRGVAWSTPRRGATYAFVARHAHRGRGVVWLFLDPTEGNWYREWCEKWQSMTRLTKPSGGTS